MEQGRFLERNADGERRIHNRKKRVKQKGKR